MISKSARWTWLVSLVAGVGAALVLAFVLSFSTAGGSYYERHFVWLFWINVAVAALLALVIVIAAVRLVLRLRHGKFGSRLLIKLAGGLYLIFLGYKYWTAPVSEQMEIPPESASRGFLTQLGITLSNPKAIAFFVALQPTSGLLLEYEGTSHFRATASKCQDWFWKSI